MGDELRRVIENRQALIAQFRSIRRRTAGLFDLIDDSAYFARPIELRNPIVFYEGHLPAFAINTLARRALARPGIDPELETIFARGIDPDPDDFAGTSEARWPSREQVLSYASTADAMIEEILSAEDLWRPNHPFLHQGEAVFTLLEHELMHQETLLYIFHQLPYGQKRRPAGYRAPDVVSTAARHEIIDIPAGPATLGLDRKAGFGWDNEFDERVVEVPRFGIDSRPVTNGEFLEFVEAGGYHVEDNWSAPDFAWVRETGRRSPHFWRREGTGWLWRCMFEEVQLPLDWPVWVSQAEAAAFARWKGKRLPTEAEYHRAAFSDSGSSERQHPWGDEPPQHQGNFDFANWDPIAAGSCAAGASALGVRDLVGNGWEWTSTIFGPFPGFRPMATYPEYSSDFFDERHFVLKGGSPVTPAPLIRRSFRNWFRPHYPYVFAKFRCVSTIPATR
jgi:iron(II)-dependent oxidoreductase